MTRQRDSQRSKVYKAENVCGCFNNSYETLDELRQYLRLVLNDKRFHKRYPEVNGIEVKPGKGNRAYGGRRDNDICWMSFPKGFYTQMLGLHEFAHGITKIVFNTQVAGHGAEWCEVYIWLVKTFIGVDKAKKLAYQFKVKGVTRSTEKYRDAARERMVGKIEVVKPVTISSVKKTWVFNIKKEREEH